MLMLTCGNTAVLSSFEFSFLVAGNTADRSHLTSNPLFSFLMFFPFLVFLYCDFNCCKYKEYRYNWV